MTYRTILLSLNEVARLPELLEAAVTVARTQADKKAPIHVSGLYVIPAAQIYPSIGFEAIPQTFDGTQAFFREHQQKVADSFTGTMSREGLTFDFRLVESKLPVISDEVVNQARAVDLVIIAATDATAPTGVEQDFVEQVVMGSGRPVLILPNKGEALSAIKDVVVGWDGGREAARACFDALPLLRKASTVRIVSVDPQKNPANRHAVPGADIAEALARQGVKATAESYPTEGLDPGQALLRNAADAGSSLVVMGAYGHSRLSEMIFGGATKFVLARHGLPILMSH
jgi:nucleotide-binding universal stress UspA family protein